MMKPGRELDALVAEKVMGHGSQFNFSPSTNIADAWLVVEKLKEHDKDVICISVGWLMGADKFPDIYRAVVAWREHRSIQADAETAPHAICLAALKAIGYHDESH